MQGINKENDRRAKYRFEIERDVRYKLAEDGVVVAAGTGRTLNICSGGVAFTSEQALTPGGFVELSISWPVLLDETCPMRLIVFGRLLRCSGQHAVCSIDKYEFRTQSRTFQPTAPTRSDGMLQRWADGVRRETLRTSVARV
ncbi:MAG: type pilus assembly PilZ [Candidatus Solibacter sp.]|jgi:hypothetical protein|nr:type pilus assembly PilZ [Candidatus Solibacter sp.]